MKSSWKARVVAPQYPDQEALKPIETDQWSYPALLSPLRRCIQKSRNWLLGQQHDQGYWVEELEGDSILQSEYILLLAFLGEEDSDEATSLAQHLITQQTEEGHWTQYPGGPIDMSATVKAYFALKLTGHQPFEPYMQKAREVILQHGGAEKVNSFTRFYLALLGQIGYESVPSVPPEMILFPGWFPFHLDKVSAWSRTMIVPLSIMSALKPVREVPASQGIRELFLTSPETWSAPEPPESSPRSWFPWRSLFLGCDKVLKFCENRQWLPLRSLALDKAKQWLIDRFDKSDGLGAIFPGIVWSLIALKAMGEREDSAHLAYCREKLQGHVIEEKGRRRVQPCKSPVWDTSISSIALSDAGVSPLHTSQRQAAQWLLSKEVQEPGDWTSHNTAPTSGWYFEFENEFYPDVDDTAMVLMALCRMKREPTAEELDEELDSDLSMPASFRVVRPEHGEMERTDEFDTRLRSAIGRGEQWLMGMQNKDGGWGAFDKDNDAEWLCHLPFADHNAMIDPSTPDITARVLEALAACGYSTRHPAVAKAIDYLRSTQEADGSWYGRWGVNYIYGTWQVIQGLVAIGISKDDPLIQTGANWLLAHQQESGAWGESPETYENPHLRGQGSPTVSQTAWALLGLIAAGQEESEAVRRGVRYLCTQQTNTGTWEEEEFTGTGFPCVFYLRYHYYRHYFPMMALSRYASSCGENLWQTSQTKIRLMRISDHQSALQLMK